MISSHRRLAGIAVAACCSLPAAGAMAASASAATLSIAKPCVVNTDQVEGTPMTVTGTGFVAGTTVTLSGVSDPAAVSASADATGAISMQAHAPELNINKFGPGVGVKTVTATATNPDGTQTVAQAKVRVANLSVATRPTIVSDVRKDKVTFDFSGFTPGKHIYGFYTRKKSTKKTTFAKATGPCGTLKQKALLFPGGHPDKGQYTVTFESTSKYNKNAFPRIVGVLKIGEI
jgi:hypothetical protein